MVLVDCAGNCGRRVLMVLGYGNVLGYGYGLCWCGGCGLW